MVHLCQVCRKTSQDFPELSFHSIPSNLNKRNKWLELLSLTRSLPKRPLVCSNHFKESDFFFSSGRKYLNTTALPIPYGDQHEAPIRCVQIDSHDEPLTAVTNISRMDSCDPESSSDDSSSETIRSISGVLKGPLSGVDRFPKNSSRQKAWVNFVNRKGWQTTTYSVLRSKHFTDECFDKTSQCYVRLKPDAVPTLNQIKIEYDEDLSIEPTYLEETIVKEEISSTEVHEDNFSEISSTEIHETSASVSVQTDLTVEHLCSALSELDFRNNQIYSLKKKLDRLSENKNVSAEDKLESVLNDIELFMNNNFIR